MSNGYFASELSRERVRSLMAEAEAARLVSTARKARRLQRKNNRKIRNVRQASAAKPVVPAQRDARSHDAACDAAHAAHGVAASQWPSVDESEDRIAAQRRIDSRLAERERLLAAVDRSHVALSPGPGSRRRRPTGHRPWWRRLLLARQAG